MVRNLIIVKELFDDQFDEYSQLLIRLCDDTNSLCVALDYPEFYQYCRHLENEIKFMNAYDTVIDHSIKHKLYPRLRFGFVSN